MKNSRLTAKSMAYTLSTQHPTHHTRTELWSDSIVSPSKVHIPCSFRKTYQSHCGRKQSDTLHTSRTGHRIEHSPKMSHCTKRLRRRSQTWMESKSLGLNVGCSIERTRTNSRASRTKRRSSDTKVTDE